MNNTYLKDQLLASDCDTRTQLLLDYLTLHGDEHYEEDVTQMQHGLQAAFLANEAGQDPEYIAATFFSGIFPDKVIEPIRLHVTAKRYLCTVDSNYYNNLSEPSQKSFHLQGGFMDAEEKAAFEANPYHQAAVQLRIWDDTAKDVRAEVPGLDTYRNIITQVLLPASN